MTKILTINQIKDSENRYIKKHSYGKLINSASKKIQEYIINNLKDKNILFICGPGNNGHDGRLASKLLKKKNSIFEIVKNNEIDFKNLDILLRKADVVFDCIFGTGLSRKIEGAHKKLVELINDSKKNIISVDIPSGINGDSGEIMGQAIKADLTLAMGFFKPAHFLLPGKEKVGKLILLNLKLVSSLKRTPEINLIQKSYFKDSLPEFSLSINKYNRGHVLVLGGEMSGASRLVAYSARKSGCGLSTIMVDKKNLKYYLQVDPGTIIKQFKNNYSFNEDVLVLGPGLGKKFSRRKIANFINAFKGPIIIDADAISIFKDHRNSFYDLLKKKKNILLTPHDGEFKRIFGISSKSKIINCLKASNTVNNCILYKGNDTVVSLPSNKVWLNKTKGNRLATAGTGDVLCGIIAGLVAQKVDFEKAILISLWIQNEISKKKEHVVVEDFISQIPLVMNSLKNNN
jgi:NAD(P)H-hydrate epimerase